MNGEPILHPFDRSIASDGPDRLGCRHKLNQFLSNPDFDKPFMGHDSPVPPWGTMEELGKLMLDTIPRVVLLGEMGKVVLEK